MPQFVEVKTEKGTILIESAVSEKTGKLTQATGLGEKIVKKAMNLVDVIRPLTESIQESVDRLENKPDSATIEFGLSITAEGNFFVVKAAGEGSLNITFRWGK